MRQFLLTLALICLTLLPAMAAEPFAQIQPPKLVPCASPTNCDRDPKHLEAFVEGFYRWYINNANSHFAQNLTKIEKHQIRENEQKLLKTLLSPKFLKWKKASLLDQTKFNNDFCSLGTDMLLCAQDWNDNEINSARSEAITIGNELAIVTLTLSSNNKIAIRLIAEKGYWRIDGVMRMHY